MVQKKDHERLQFDLDVTMADLHEVGGLKKANEYLTSLRAFKDSKNQEIANLNAARGMLSSLRLPDQSDR